MDRATRASLVASFASGVAKMKRPLGPQSLRSGPTDRPKVRSLASISSDVK